jgi:hypothetical protein
LKDNKLIAKEKISYDTKKIRTFGRLKGRKLTLNQKIGLEYLESDISFDPISDIDFLKKKNVG